jgi:hypothetical protein
MALTSAALERQSLEPWNVVLACAGCGAELTIEPDRHTADCEFCHATNVVDLGGVATCFRIATTLDEGAAHAAAVRALREHGLAQARLEAPLGQVSYVPFWSVTEPSGVRSVLALDSADLPLPHDVTQPAGQLDRLDLGGDAGFTAALLEPTVPLPAALGRLGAGREAKISLVYAPYRTATFSWGGETFELLVDLATGRVHAPLWPYVHDPRLDRRLGRLLVAALVSFTAAALLVPGLVPAVLVTLLVAVPLWWALDRSVVTSAEKAP